MALFPVSPTNGQQTNVNSITYTYDSSQTAWVRTAVDGNISAGNAVFSGNLAVGSNLTVAGNAFLATTSGNVGIGTSSPVYKLDVNKGSAGTIARFTDGVAQTLVIKTLDTSGVVIQNDNSGYIAFNNSAERMRITSDGNVGIGTSAPKTRLQTSSGATLNAPVLGNAANAPVYITNNDSAYGLVFGTNAADGHAWIQAQRTDSTATAYNITLNEAGGKVGIGTSTPASKIDVRSGDITVSRTAAGLAGDAALYFGNGNNNYIFSGDASNIMAFAVNGSERVRVDVNGNVGIGNTAPTDKLSVNGNVAADNFVGNGITNGTSNIVVAASGNVTISSAGNLNRFTVTGTGANVTGNLYQTSGSVTLNGIVLANTIYTYYTTIYGPGGSLAFSDTGNGSTRQYNVYNDTGNVFTIDQNGTSGIWRFYGSNGAFASNTVVSTNNFISGVTTNITANGSTQSTATAMTKDINVVSTVLTGNGVTLPTAVAGYRISIINTSANALNVYPLGNGIINALGANNAYSLAANARLQIVCTSSTTAPGGQWYTL